MLKEKIKPLLLSFRTPPAVRPQAILIGKMIPEWLAQGLNPVIITYKNGSDWKINLPIYEIHQIRMNKFLRRIPPARMFLRQRYLQKIFELASQVIKKHNPNLVFSFANPQESNILGALLKDKLGIKFISHFSDPWYDSPFQSLSFWGKKRVLQQEKYIVKNSDRIIFISDELKELVMKKYPPDWQKKALVIHHAYDPRDYPRVKKEKGGRFIFSYMGAFYKKRNPEILFKALRKLLERKKDLAQKFVLKIIGSAVSYTDFSINDLQELIDLYGLKEMIEIIPQVSFSESLKYMKLSDCLIVIDADFAQNFCFPSKIVDYAGSGRMILGIVNDDSPSADFLNKLGYLHFNYKQIDELSGYLEKLILRKANINVNSDYLKQFDIRRTTAQLIKTFDEVLNPSDPS